jgi:short-subunit dehydrogenase
MNYESPAGVAVVTGASSGIGAIYADRLAKRGFDLIVVARDEARLQALSERLAKDTGRTVTPLRADLTNSTDVAKVEQVLREDDAITMLVVMSAEDMVDAALVGLDQGERVTIPSLHDRDAWDRLEAARVSISQQFGNTAPALRYRAAS